MLLLFFQGFCPISRLDSIGRDQRFTEVQGLNYSRKRCMERLNEGEKRFVWEACVIVLSDCYHSITNLLDFII
jgi:hypothetical protein